MDEPTTHLDIPSVEALVGALKEFEGTLCFISHDLYFINALADHVAHIENGKVTMYPGNYDYFKYRQEQLQAEAAAAPAAVEAASRSENTSGSQKEERRLKKLRDQKIRKAGKLDEEIVLLRRNMETLASRLADPAIHADYEKVRSIGAEIAALEETISAKTAEKDGYLRE